MCCILLLLPRVYNALLCGALVYLFIFFFKMLISPPHSVATVREKSLEIEKFSRSGKSKGSLVLVKEIGKKLERVGGISKFCQNWDVYVSLLNSQRLINL